MVMASRIVESQEKSTSRKVSAFSWYSVCMRLLLTANGIQNEAISAKLRELLGAPTSETKLVYIPTATVIEEGDHSWCINDLSRLYSLGWAEFNVLELNGIPKQNISRRLSNCDAVYVEGGNVYHLANSIQSNGLVDILSEILRDKVYIGSSAGSMIFSRAFNEKSAELFNELPQLHELGIMSIRSPFDLFDWYLKPHVNSPDFPERTSSWMEKIAQKADFQMYALDDESALAITDAGIEVVSEGWWHLYNDR